MTLTTPYVYCTVHVNITIAPVPCENDVERSVQVVEPPVALRNAQTLVADVFCAGSNRLNPANTPGSCVTLTV